MKKGEFEKECEEYKALIDEFEEIDKTSDNDGDLDPVRDKMHALDEKVKANGRDYANAFRSYLDAKTHGNEYIDVSDVVWDSDVPRMIDGFRDVGINHFTFSSTWSEAVQTAWLFTENGCTLEGMVMVNGNRNWETKEYEKRPAYLFSIK